MYLRASKIYLQYGFASNDRFSYYQVHFNSDIPFRKIFCSNDDFVNYIRSIETEGNNKLRKATNFLSEYFELCKTQHTNQPIFTFKGKADKVKPYSYATYELFLKVKLLNNCY